MTVLVSLFVALALGIDALLMFRSCAEATPVRLSHGLVTAVVTALFSALMMWAGFLLAHLFSYMGDNGNATVIYMGFFLFVVVKLLIAHRRNSDTTAFDISQWGIVFQLAFLLSVNALFLGLGMGYLFRPLWTRAVALTLCALSTFALSYWGIMLGRNKIAMRHRRWRLMEVLLVLAAALLGLFIR